MANFKQHLTLGAVGSGLLIAPLLGAQYITTSQASLLWVCGALGSVIPDVDSDNATALDIVFLMLSFIAIYVVLDFYAQNKSGVEIVGLVIASFVLSMLAKVIFQKVTVHRGSFHSILASVFFGLITCVFTWRINQVTPMVAWLAGAFMTIGALMHLLLDEIFSVDFMNAYIKRSFGSAFKLFDWRRWPASLGLLFACGGLAWIAPPIDTFTEVFVNTQTYQQLAHNLLPQGWNF